MLATLQRQCGNNYKQIFASVLMKTHGNNTETYLPGWFQYRHILASALTVLSYTCQCGNSIDRHLPM